MLDGAFQVRVEKALAELLKGQAVHGVRIEGINSRLDKLNGKTDSTINRVDVLEAINDLKKGASQQLGKTLDTVSPLIKIAGLLVAGAILGNADKVSVILGHIFK